MGKTAVKETEVVETETKETEAAEETTSAEKTVKLRLFKDNGKYKEPVFVGVNGKTYMIERGKEVEVPIYVAEVLRNSEDQLAEADRVMMDAAFNENE